VSPIVAALDTNGDGTLSADEIAAASTSLKKLDKNGDGQLTQEEFRPAPPEGGAQGNGQRGQRGGDGPKPPGNGGGDAAGAAKKRPAAE
jgi:hypothetical protein